MCQNIYPCLIENNKYSNVSLRSIRRGELNYVVIHNTQNTNYTNNGVWLFILNKKFTYLVAKHLDWLDVCLHGRRKYVGDQKR